MNGAIPDLQQRAKGLRNCRRASPAVMQPSPELARTLHGAPCLLDLRRRDIVQMPERNCARAASASGIISQLNLRRRRHGALVFVVNSVGSGRRPPATVSEIMVNGAGRVFVERWSLESTPPGSPAK